MTGDHPGKYSRKHPAGTAPDPAIVAALGEVTEDGRVSCAVAHDLADELAVTPAAVGRTMDLLEYRIVKCQMGIFGYEPEKKIVKPATAVSDELRDRLPEGRASRSHLLCRLLEGRRGSGIQKIAVAAACETLGSRSSLASWEPSDPESRPEDGRRAAFAVRAPWPRRAPVPGVGGWHGPHPDAAARLLVWPWADIGFARAFVLLAPRARGSSICRPSTLT